MGNKPANVGKPWTPAQDTQLPREGPGNTPTAVIGLHLERTVDSRAFDLGVSLKPTNQSPYGTSKGSSGKRSR